MQMISLDLRRFNAPPSAKFVSGSVHLTLFNGTEKAF